MGNCFSKENPSPAPLDMESKAQVLVAGPVGEVVPVAPVIPPPPPSISEILPGLFISGRISQPQVRPTHDTHQITTVVSLVSMAQDTWQQKDFKRTVKPGRHLWIQCIDEPSQDLLKHMEECCDFIDKFYPTEVQPAGERSPEEFPTTPSPNGSVLVHCAAGISRSPTIVIAYLMRKQRKSYKKVLAEVRKKRPVVNPRPQFEIQLGIWEKTGYRIWEDKKKTIPKAEYKEYLDRREAYLKSELEAGNMEIRLKHGSRFDRKPGVK